MPAAPGLQLHHALHLTRLASTEGAGELRGRAALRALSQRDSAGAAPVRERLPCRTLGGVETYPRSQWASDAQPIAALWGNWVPIGAKGHRLPVVHE